MNSRPSSGAFDGAGGPFGPDFGLSRAVLRGYKVFPPRFRVVHSDSASPFLKVVVLDLRSPLQIRKERDI
jgi:hypothetical protein